MIYYLAIITMRYCTKNKLQEAITKYIDSLDRKLIPDSELKMFKHNVKCSIKSLVLQHPKCKPINPIWWNDNDGDWHLSLNGESIVNFSLERGYLEVKKCL